MASLEHQIANLRLQMTALEASTKTASLPEAVAKVQHTIKWSAAIVAVALVASSLVRLVIDDRVAGLERRVIQLEKRIEALEKRDPM